MSFRPGYFILLIAPEYFLILRMLGTFSHARMEAVSAAEQIRDLLATPQGEGARAAGHGAHRREIRGAPSVEFCEVCFSYSGKLVLDGASFRIGEGERVALTGGSIDGLIASLTTKNKSLAQQTAKK